MPVGFFDPDQRRPALYKDSKGAECVETGRYWRSDDVYTRDHAAIGLPNPHRGLGPGGAVGALGTRRSIRDRLHATVP